MLSEGIGASSGRRIHTSAAGYVPLIMLPVLVWLTLDVLHVTPRPHAPRIAPKAEAAMAPAEADSAAAVPAPDWTYWQKALISANASGLPPPIFRGNWMEGAEARLRWFEFDGTARQMRPNTWWGYEDPAPKQADAQGADGGAPAGRRLSATRSAGSDGDGTRHGGQYQGAGDSDIGRGSRKLAGPGSTGFRRLQRVQSKGEASGSSAGSNRRRGGRRRAQEEEAGSRPESWERRLPPLQVKGPAPEGASAAEERSFYLPWIKKDLEPWRKHGITQDDLRRAEELAGHEGPYCFGDQFMFQIVGGRLYVQYQTTNREQPGVHTRMSSGWFPGNEGPGLAVAKGHVPYILFVLLDVLRAFPGQVPDLAAAVHTSDFPCVKAHPNVTDMEFRDPKLRLPWEHYNGHPIPIFGYNRREGFLDLLFPDFSYFGHEYSQITDPTGRMLNGLPQQFDIIVATHGFTPLERRRPKVMWRGRASDEPRDAVRKRLQGCPAELEKKGHKGAAELFDVVAPPLGEITQVTLKSNGAYRYPVYIDAGAYSSSLKQKLMAGSPMLMIKHRYHEWFTSALMPGYTHLAVDDGPDMCEDVHQKVLLMEEMVVEQAAAVQTANFPPPWLQPHAGSWYQHPWGMDMGNDTEMFQQLRDWTLAQRGIAVAGVNAYEDSDLYVPQPEVLEDSETDATSGDDNSTAAEPAPLAQLGEDPGRRSFWEWLAGPSRQAEAETARRRAQQQALLEARNKLAARREWARQQLDADKAKQRWEDRQEGLRAAVPWDLWGRANGTWGSPLLPWEIGAFGQLFIRDRLRIRDVRLYVRDFLTEYAKLQKFKPAPAPLARCIDWERMLMEFEWPHYKEDVEQLLHFYPYLRQPFNYNCSDDPLEAGRAPYSPGHDAGDVWKESEEWQQAWQRKQEAAKQQNQEQEAAAQEQQDRSGSGEARQQQQQQQAQGTEQSAAQPDDAGQQT